MSGDRVGTDTNVLLRVVQGDNPHHARAVQALRQRTLTGDEIVVVPQNVVEFWTVATRPVENNGLGMTPRETKEHVEDILRAFTFLPDTVGSFARWFDLIDRYEVRGKTTHDAASGGDAVGQRRAPVADVQRQGFHAVRGDSDGGAVGFTRRGRLSNSHRGRPSNPIPVRPRCPCNG